MRLIDADALIKDTWFVVIKGENIDDISEQIIRQCKRIVSEAPTIDAVSVVRRKWEEKETFHNADDNPIIEEWQSARCSMCERYHTTPYMYYFNDYNFCPNCGADMREREGE